MSNIEVSQLVEHLGSAHSTLPISNPITGNVIYELPQLSAEQVADKVKFARIAQSEWAETPISVRSEILYRLHDLILEHQDEFMDVVQLETGKARAHAFEEVAGSLGAARYYAKIAKKALKPKKTVSSVPLLTKTWVNHVPVGVVEIGRAHV